MKLKLLSIRKFFLEVKKGFLKENRSISISGILGLIIGFAWILISGLNLVEGNIVGLAMSLWIFIQVFILLIGFFSGALKAFLSYFSGLLIGVMLCGSIILVIKFTNWLLEIFIK